MSEHCTLVVVLDFEGIDDSLQQAIKVQFAERLQALGKVLYHRKTPVLDVDTVGKDSYELYAAGLDYCFLVSEKKQYIKARTAFIESVNYSQYKHIVCEEQPQGYHKLPQLLLSFRGEGDNQVNLAIRRNHNVNQPEWRTLFSGTMRCQVSNGQMAVDSSEFDTVIDFLGLYHDH